MASLSEEGPAIVPDTAISSPRTEETAPVAEDIVDVKDDSSDNEQAPSTSPVASLGGEKEKRSAIPHYAQTTMVRRTKLKNKFHRKFKRSQQFVHEHNRDPDWYKHNKHIIICSWSGRPIFSLYGDETKLSAYMGVVSAIISNFQRLDDVVRTIIAGDTKFVFLLKGPVYLLAISRTPESVKQLKTQLNYVHDQILSVLTINCHRILENRPQYDIRNLMVGTETLLADLIHESNRYASVEFCGWFEFLMSY